MIIEHNSQIPRHALYWILAAVILVILPQMMRMPLWISFIAILCVTWRFCISWGWVSYPSRLTRNVVVVFTLIVSASQIRALGIGLDSAASLLALGFVFKLIEMHQKRDIYVMLSLCFIMSMVAFLYDQSVLSTLYVSTVLLVAVGALVAVNRSPFEQRAASTAKLAVLIAAQALPLAVILFAVFPRIAPLWAVPLQNNVSSTGVSDEMSPGDIAQLGRSGDLAFRVQFSSHLPPLHENLYWRGLVLDDFDGTTWSRTRASSSYGSATQLQNFQYNWENRVLAEGEPLQYNVIMEATQQPWIFGLHLAQPIENNLYQSRNFEIFNNGIITQRISYDLLSFQTNKTDLFLLDSQRSRNTSLPDTGNPESREFARQLRASVDSDLDYVYQVLAHFQQNPFFYTLNPRTLDQDRVDNFLFSTREGFCEHYASSFAFLMRAAGIPSRVVVGYQGAEYNPFEDYLMVYQYNAHAWNEVWLEGEGWVRFDPTAAVSPERIRLGPEAALRDDPAFMEEALFSSMRFGGFGGVMNSLRLRFDAIEYEWNRRVVNYDQDTQFELFEQLFGEVTEQKVISLLVFLGGLAIVIIALLIVGVGGSSRRNPLESLYLRIAEELDKAGLGRLSGEGPHNYRDRVSAQRPELGELMATVTSAYVRQSYEVDASALARQRQDIKQMRMALNQLRFKLSNLSRFMPRN